MASTGWAIVAIPSEKDPVWQYSSQEIPHMTLLFLGDQNPDADTAERIFDYIQHVAETALTPFYMSVDRRGVLGPDQADVLFFKKNRSASLITNTRNFLLQNPDILAAYNSTEQYPEWTPHLTMGYPETPAPKDDRDYPGFWSVAFDRIALWTGEYEGPTFQLEEREPESEAMSMSETARAYLEHYGIKGMHWGQRKASVDVRDGETVVTQPKAGGSLMVAGGKGIPAHEDAVKAATYKQQAKSSTVNALSNKELKDLVNRMNLEQQLSDLTTKEAVRNQTLGQKFIQGLVGDLVNVGQQKGKNYVVGKVSNAGKKADPAPRREYDEQFAKARRASS
jgi:2'-5' RNA ligase